MAAPASTIYHVSHVHPLLLYPVVFQINHPHMMRTSCCNEPNRTDSVELFYGCDYCNFFIHKRCSEMPTSLQHPSHHPLHTLTLLLLSPDFQQGSVVCNGCLRIIADGFFYHCSYCNYDLHARCASLPPTICHPSHHHPLSLSFHGSPLQTGYWYCDVCSGPLHGKPWFYTCTPCNYGVHIGCLTSHHAGALSSVLPNAYQGIQMPSAPGPMMPAPAMMPTPAGYGSSRDHETNMYIIDNIG